MFATTFLGHQGWLFQSGSSCLLVDPLLCEEFGHAHALDYRVYPPRVLKPEAFPRVDAVLLTHEHDDHFDIPSLLKIDRRIPIFLSARSSVAGYKILSAMGFTVQPLVPGIGMSAGELAVLPLCGDHINTRSGDEWDTLPFLVHHAHQAGSFFSTVDVTLTAAHLAMAKVAAPQPGLIGWTNNAIDRSFMTDYLPSRGDATDSVIARMRAGHGQIREQWGAPAALLLCAGGYAFQGARAWLNQRLFCTDSERACQTLAAEIPSARFFATQPGQTFVMEDNRLVSVQPEAPFLTTAPPETWPSRQKGAAGEAPPDYAPASGRPVLEPKEQARLRQRLNEFAGALTGGALFRSLYSLLDIEVVGRVPTFAFVLRSGAERLVFGYNPNACSFEPGRPDDPRAEYLAGMECWATDLLAVLGGELGPIALSYGRSYLWNALPQRFNFDPFAELYRVSHPLRRPAEFLQSYGKLWRKHAETPVLILPR